MANYRPEMGSEEAAGRRKPFREVSRRHWWLRGDWA